MDDDLNPYSPSHVPEISTVPRPQQPAGKGLSGFEKFCAVLAFMLAIPLMILGALGLFLGCKANFTLPPILGVIPAFIAWGIIRPIMVAWNPVPRL